MKISVLEESLSKYFFCSLILNARWEFLIQKENAFSEIESLEKIDNSKVYLRVEDSVEAKELSKKLKELLIKEYIGDTPVYIFANKEKQKFKVPRDRWISLESDVISLLKENLGEENVKIQE